ncbi:MAG: hypothetical protein RLZZ347_307 [Candidatus Parcubacteria bacterium]
MKCKQAVIWSLIHGKKHGSLNEKDVTIGATIPLVSALFPGINYYSIPGFNQVMRDCVLPILVKRFAHLQTIHASKIDPRATIEVVEALPSKGYEWQDSRRWMAKFRKILVSA